MLAQCPRQAARHSLLEKLQGTMSPSRTSPVITEHRRGLVSVLRGRRAPPGGRGTVCKGLEFTRTVSTRCQGARRRARAIGHGGEGEGPQRKWHLSKWQLRCSRVAGMYFNIIVIQRGDNLLASSTVGMMAVWGQQPGLRKKPFCRFTQHIKNSQSTKGNIWEKEHFHSKFLWYALCVYSSN